MLIKIKRLIMFMVLSLKQPVQMQCNSAMAGKSIYKLQINTIDKDLIFKLEMNWIMAELDI